MRKIQQPQREEQNASIPLSRRTALGVLGAGVLGIGTTTTASARGRTDVVLDFENFGPENLAFDSDGNLYMTIGLSGEILRLDADDTTGTDLDPEEVTENIASFDPHEGFVTGIVADDGCLFVAVSSFADNHGIWKVDINNDENDNDEPDLTQLASDMTLPNGMLFHPCDDGLLVSDSLGGSIWHVYENGANGWDAEEWVDDENLNPNDELDPDFQIGANGLATKDSNAVYVANTNFGRIVRVPVEDDGSAGEPETYVEEDDRLIGADGITFDRAGKLIVAVNGQNTVVRIPSPEAELTVLADEDDGLDFPADVSFGPAPQGLFIANFAFRFDPDDPDEPDPSLMRINRA